MSDMNKRPILLITGKSGVGKDTIADYLCNNFGYTKVKSYTTRQPRYEGEDTHIFVTKEEFDKLHDKVARSRRKGAEYCATREQVDNADIYIIDPPGIQYFFDAYETERKILVIEITCPEVERIQRVFARCMDGNKELVDRRDLDGFIYDSYYRILETAAYMRCYKRIVNQNGNMQSAIKEIMTFVRKSTFPIVQKKLIYVSHPFQNKPENVKDIECYITKWKDKYKDCVFVSPVHCFGFMYEKMSYEDGLNQCLQLLSICDEMWVCGNYENSTGCCAEIEFCKAYSIPYLLKHNGVVTLS